MSADTGAVDAAVLEACRVFWNTSDELGDGSIETFHESMQAAIQAYQRANAERVMALVDAFHDAAKEYGQLSALSEQPWADSDAEPDARRKSDDAYAALLLAVVGEVQK